MNHWQFALVQHPMILGVHEDRGVPVIWERIPPAGAPNIAEYADRVRRNLDALKKYPDLKLNYELSGVELQILIDNASDIGPVMREMVEKGQLGHPLRYDRRRRSATTPRGQLGVDELR